MKFLSTILFVIIMMLTTQNGVAQTTSPFGFEGNNVGSWTSSASSETAAINATAAMVRTGSYSLKLTTTHTGKGNKQWYATDPYAASASNVYIYYIYWAKAQDAGTAVDASFRYGSTAPPSGSGNSANASSGAALSTTTWSRVINSVTTSSARYYYPGPRKTQSNGATSFYMDDAIIYTSMNSTADTVAPGAPSAVASTVSGNLVNLTWTSNTDANTGVQATMLLRTANLTASAPDLHDQAQYSATGGINGPNTIGDWTVIKDSIGATATSYLDASAPQGNYKYAIVLRDLAYNYSVAAISPTINVGLPIPTIFTDLTGFTNIFPTTIAGSYSAEQHYTVTGYNLTGNIVVTAPTGFVVSLSTGTAFTNSQSVTLIPTGTSVASTPIYVKYNPATATGASGTLNITNTSTGAVLQNVPVSGTSLAVEPVTSGSISFGRITDTKITINLPTVGNGNKRLIAIHVGSDVTFVPVDGTAVAGVDSDFTTATNQGNGNKVIYDGNNQGNNVVTVTGLTKSTLYYFAVYEYNVGTGSSQNYVQVAPVTALASTNETNVSVPGSPAITNITVYPNPFTNQLHIDNFTRSGYTALLYDITGKTWKAPVLGNIIETTTLPAGTYLLSIYDTKGTLLHSSNVIKMN